MDPSWVQTMQKNDTWSYLINGAKYVGESYIFREMDWTLGKFGEETHVFICFHGNV